MTDTPPAHGERPSPALAIFSAKLAWSDIPERVRHEAKRFLVNYFACAIAGSGQPAITRQLRLLPQLSGPPTSSIIGQSPKTDMLWASYLNASSANLFDFDDTHFPTILHPTAPVAPVLFALAETRPGSMSGKDLLLALVIGIETQCRIANAVSPEHYRNGNHITATCGVFGAALAAGRAMQLNETQLHAALGHASAQSSGLVETLGTASKSVGVGQSARNGLYSALLASEGLLGPDQPLEGRYGFLNVASPLPVPARILAGLGRDWQLLHNICKPYPCGVVLNPVIDACLALRDQPDFAASSIAAIVLTGHSLLRQRADRPAVETGNLAQVSAQHAAAVSLLRGRAGLSEFSDAAVHDPEIRALGRKVSFVDDDRFSVDSAAIELRFADGRVRRMQVDHARGTLKNPPTDADLDTKLDDLCRFRNTGLKSAPLANTLWSMDTQADAATAMAMLHT